MSEERLKQMEKATLNHCGRPHLRVHKPAQDFLGDLRNPPEWMEPVVGLLGDHGETSYRYFKGTQNPFTEHQVNPRF